jgi:hypothetical protein
MSSTPRSTSPQTDDFAFRSYGIHQASLPPGQRAGFDTTGLEVTEKDKGKMVDLFSKQNAEVKRRYAKKYAEEQANDSNAKKASGLASRRRGHSPGPIDTSGGVRNNRDKGKGRRKGDDGQRKAADFGGDAWDMFGGGKEDERQAAAAFGDAGDLDPFGPGNVDVSNAANFGTVDDMFDAPPPPRQEQQDQRTPTQAEKLRHADIPPTSPGFKVRLTQTAPHLLDEWERMAEKMDEAAKNAQASANKWQEKYEWEKKSKEEILKRMTGGGGEEEEEEDNQASASKGTTQDPRTRQISQTTSFITPEGWHYGPENATPASSSSVTKSNNNQSALTLLTTQLTLHLLPAITLLSAKTPLNKKDVLKAITKTQEAHRIAKKARQKQPQSPTAMDRRAGLSTQSSTIAGYAALYARCCFYLGVSKMAMTRLDGVDRRPELDFQKAAAEGKGLCVEAVWAEKWERGYRSIVLPILRKEEEVDGEEQEEREEREMHASRSARGSWFEGMKRWSGLGGGRLGGDSNEGEGKSPKPKPMGFGGGLNALFGTNEKEEGTDSPGPSSGTPRRKVERVPTFDSVSEGSEAPDDEGEEDGGGEQEGGQGNGGDEPPSSSSDDDDDASQTSKTSSPVSPLLYQDGVPYSASHPWGRGDVLGHGQPFQMFQSPEHIGEDGETYKDEDEEAEVEHRRVHGGAVLGGFRNVADLSPSARTPRTPGGGAVGRSPLGLGISETGEVVEEEEEGMDSDDEFGPAQIDFSEDADIDVPGVSGEKAEDPRRESILRPINTGSTDELPPPATSGSRHKTSVSFWSGMPSASSLVDDSESGQRSPGGTSILDRRRLSHGLMSAARGGLAAITTGRTQTPRLDQLKEAEEGQSPFRSSFAEGVLHHRRQGSSSFWDRRSPGNSPGAAAAKKSPPSASSASGRGWSMFGDRSPQVDLEKGSPTGKGGGEEGEGA